MPRLSIGDLAKAANVSIDTVRFYEKRGLLPQPSRRPSGFREYSPLDIPRLRFIRRARALGFALEEIAELLTLFLPAQAQPAAPHVIGRKLGAIDAKIAELQRWRAALEQVLRETELRGYTMHSILDLLDDPVKGNVLPEERFHDHP